MPGRRLAPPRVTAEADHQALIQAESLLVDQAMAGQYPVDLVRHPAPTPTTSRLSLVAAVHITPAPKARDTTTYGLTPPADLHLASVVLTPQGVRHPVGTVLTPQAVHHPVEVALIPQGVRHLVEAVLTPQDVRHPVGAVLTPQGVRHPVEEVYTPQGNLQEAAGSLVIRDPA